MRKGKVKPPINGNTLEFLETQLDDFCCAAQHLPHKQTNWRRGHTPVTLPILLKDPQILLIGRGKLTLHKAQILHKMESLFSVTKS